ncbi:MAG: manganese transporter ATP-binding protein [Verrucomicrobiales bacterium]|nr:manganese transporter ATP-binding protein [Verrucomicrobiales bacterium]
MTTETLITLQEVGVGYDRQAVLRGVNLQIRRGTFTGLLGANGTGKSTLLKTLVGIIPAVEGVIQLGNVEGHPAVFGYVPQREALDPIFLLSSFEVVLMGACGRVGPGRRFSHGEKDLAHDCLRRTGADQLSRKRFSQLSGGQKQRVLIARALAARPDMLLLDEPTAGIDTAATQAIMELLRQLHREQKLTILMVNHDLPVVRRYVDEVIWLHEGKVLQGSVQELLSREKVEQILDLELS